MLKITNRQSEILCLLAEGYTIPDIARRLEITLGCAHTHVSTLRAASGVDTRNKADCLRLLGEVQDPSTKAGPTPRQLEVLTLLSQGKSAWDISRATMLSPTTIANAISQGRKRLLLALGQRTAIGENLKQLLDKWRERTGTPAAPITEDPMF